MKFSSIVAAVSMTSFADAQLGFGSAKHVIVIGVDGLGGMYLDRTLENQPGNTTRPDLENLDMMMAEGVYSVRARAQMPSVSGPNWGTIITGMNPEDSGIDSNSWTPNSAAPAQPNVSGMPPANAVGKVPEIPGSPEPEDPTVCFTGDGNNYRGDIAVTSSGKTCQSWAVTSPNSHNRNEVNYPGMGLGDHNFCRNPDGEPNGPWCYNAEGTSPRWEYCDVPRCPNDQPVETILPESMWRAAKKQNENIKTAVSFNWGWIDYFMDDSVDMHFQGNDNAVGAAMCSYIENEQPDLMFIHFDEVDGAGHGSGWGTTRYYDQIANVDRLIGDVLDSLENSGMMDETLVMVSSDHGGNNFGHGGFTQAEMFIPVIFYGAGLQSHGVQNRRVLSNRDLAPTALYALGLREGDYMTGRTASEIFEQQ